MQEASEIQIDNKDNPPQRCIAVYDLGGPKTVEMVVRLAARKNWNPVHWFGSLPENEDRVRTRFPEVHYYSKKDVIRRKLTSSVPNTDWPRRDIDVIKHLAVYDPVLYPVFLREARKLYGMDQIAEYHEVITTWYHFFEYINPDLVLFGKIPAHIYDYLTYLLCKERGIPTLMLLRHHHVPGVVMPTNHFEKPPPRIAARYYELVNTDSYRQIKLAENWQQYLDRMSGAYEESMYNSFRRRYAIDHKIDYVKLRDTIPRKLMDVITGRRSVFYARALAREIMTLPRRWLLRWSYERKALQPDYNAPYIFVPLHVQPERTSVPQGDIFGHQLLMVEILSRALPEGWKLYVKEHPVQLYDRPAYKFFRTPVFYDELLQFKNVQLVPSRITARKLIDNARAVAGVTSTTCWEALFRGKPSMLFGHVWFSFCEGIFNIQDHASCKNALAVIHNGYTVDRDKLRACLYAIENEAITSAPDPRNLNAESERKWIAWTDKISSQIGSDGNVIMLQSTDQLLHAHN